MACLEERTARGCVDDRRMMAGSNANGPDAVLVFCQDTAGPAALSVRTGRHSGFHFSDRASKIRSRVFPVSPYTRTTYCWLRAPRMYTLPVDAVPAAVKVAAFPDPSRIGSLPGGVPPGSTGGNPGSVAN